MPGVTLGGKPHSNKGDTRAQQQRKQQRAKENMSVTGIKPTKSGSSGMTLFMSRVQKRAFEDIEDQAVFVGDFVATINDMRKTSAKAIIANLTIPASYQVEAMDAMDACAMGFVMCRWYFVPRRPFMPDGDGDELNGDDT